MSNSTASSSDRYGTARAALAAHDDPSIAVIGADGFPLIGSVERAEWVISQVRPLVEADVDHKMRQIFMDTNYANGLASMPDPLAALAELSARLATQAEKFHATERELHELQRQRDAVRAFLGTGASA